MHFIIEPSRKRETQGLQTFMEVYFGFNLKAFVKLKLVTLLRLL